LGNKPKTTDTDPQPMTVHPFYIMHIHERSFVFGIIIYKY